MIVNATKNDFINHWCVNYDEFMQIMMNSCKLRGIWKGDNCSWMWCKPKPEKTFFEKKNAKTVLHVC